MNSNSFNNKKSLSQQDECDNHTRQEKPARAYNGNTMPQALPAGAMSFRLLFHSLHFLALVFTTISLVCFGVQEKKKLEKIAVSVFRCFVV